MNMRLINCLILISSCFAAQLGYASNQIDTKNIDNTESTVPNDINQQLKSTDSITNTEEKTDAIPDDVSQQSNSTDSIANKEEKTDAIPDDVNQQSNSIDTITNT